MKIKSILWAFKESNQKLLFEYLKNVLTNKFFFWVTQRKINSPTFYIDIPDNVMARYLYNLVFAIADSGYNVKIKANLKLFGNLFDYSHLILKTKNVKAVFSEPNNEDVILTTIKDKYSKSILIDLNFYSKKINIQNQIIAPLMMHPTNYNKEYHKQIKLLRRKDKRKIIFFSGSIQEKNYNSPLLKKIHKTPTRFILLKFLRSYFVNIVYQPENREKLFTALKSSSHKVIIADRAHAPIYPDEWLGVLSEMRFFIAFPGTTIPFCHNIVEAMSVGSIPILAYAHQMPKGLIDGVNCLIYTDENSFLQKIEEALNMQEEKLRKMAINAIKYFDKALDYSQFGKLLINKRPKKIYANAEFYSLQLLDDELNTNYTQMYPNA